MITYKSVFEIYFNKIVKKGLQKCIREKLKNVLDIHPKQNGSEHTHDPQVLTPTFKIYSLFKNQIYDFVFPNPLFCCNLRHDTLGIQIHCLKSLYPDLYIFVSPTYPSKDIRCDGLNIIKKPFIYKSVFETVSSKQKRRKTPSNNLQKNYSLIIQETEIHLLGLPKPIFCCNLRHGTLCVKHLNTFSKTSI